MTKHVRERIEYADLRGAHVVSDHHLERCMLSICNAVAKCDAERPVFRGILVKDCNLESPDTIGAIFEDCTIDGLRTNPIIWVHGCAFRHVTVRGNLGQFIIGASGRTGDDAIDEASARFYAEVDWALDIREARAATLDIHNVPLHLILRDSETQAIIHKARLPSWRR